MTTRGGITGRRTARLEGLSAVSGDAATAQTRAENSAGRAGGTGAEGGAGTARELTGDEGGRRERELCVTTLTRRGEDGDSGGPQYHCTKKREQHVLDSVTKLLGDDDPFAQGYTQGPFWDDLTIYATSLRRLSSRRAGGGRRARRAAARGARGRSE
jgi:hypothetical protein